jgi:RNA polymerase sigma-70 factor (ECF subfamily)
VEAVTDDLPYVTMERDQPAPSADEDWRGIFADLAAGRLSALDALYDAAATQLYGLALWRTGSEEDAADVVQDVFVRVAEQGPRLASVRNPRAWLLTVTRRIAVDHVRRKSRRATEPLDEYPFLTAADGHSERMLDAAQVSVLLSALPETCREILYLRHFVGCTYSEIGQIVGVPKFTAASRYRSGIEKLRKLMENDHEAR